MTARHRLATALGPLALVLVLLAACAPEPGAPASDSPSASATASPTGSPSASPTPTPSATPVTFPTDCRAMLSEAVLSQLGGTPLNDPATGVPTGVQPDGSLVCLWRDPGADTTFLETTVSRVDRGPALELLNRLAGEQGFTCYTPTGGTRCERSWVNEQYPVQDGRTLFWRDGVMIDTSYSNLAPSGYTDSIVAHLFG
ncbi:MAG: hypothetical protein NT132_00035 [Microbacterium sp.]|uniref:hypothetical protein n=1 Tax=Microbacterium sp. TaxID=51671 RepID=UPI002619CB64|nr:hypothetical protein [Microbacterium sp.]MCX6500807.1 hypothetical protein [Microbacterium sp.]